MADSFFIIPVRSFLLAGAWLLLSSAGACGQAGTTEWLAILRNEMARSAGYDGEKAARISRLHQQPLPARPDSQFLYYGLFYREYAVFHFDSAYFYAKQLQSAATASRNVSLQTVASLQLAQTLLTAGLFKEAFDTLHMIHPGQLTDSLRAEYYILAARSYFDLADYAHDNSYTRLYSQEAAACLDSALRLLPAGSFNWHYYHGLQDVRAGDVRNASYHFSKALQWPGLSLHEQAIIYSTASDMYIRKSQQDSAIILLAKAAIADIRSSTKETAAIFNLATLLFNEGDITRASLFIQKAAEDAKTYGARQRMMQLSSILPLIEAKRMASLQAEKTGVTRYALLMSILFIILAILGTVVILQVRKMKKQQKEINQKNVSLYHLVEEKEWLLKEIHHRVKNNLHIITSLLESQSAYLQNDALAAIRNSQHRIFAMSLIHQKLYQPEKNVTSIDMAAYLHELASHLKDSFDSGQRVRFSMDTGRVQLDISLAVPLGLILNEAITNAMKYAFPGNREGEITISIKDSGNNTLLLTVADNGIGLPGNFHIDQSGSLGMKLMQGLSEDMAARFAIESKEGTQITVEFIPGSYVQPAENKQ